MTADWPAGYDRRVIAEVDSTNAEALRMAAAGQNGPVWIQALRQTAGRGRRGRQWTSQTGNLFASLLIEPSQGLAQMGQVSFVAALAASDMVGGFAPTADVKVKWPNDVLTNGAKIVGILLEVAPKRQALAIGIGVNLVHCPADTPYGAMSLTDLGVAAPAPQDALPPLAHSFARWYARWQTQGFSPIREAWLARATGLGREICVRLPREEVRGTFEGVDADGALLLSRGSRRRTIAAGDVFFP